jgi:hypothetical protein
VDQAHTRRCWALACHACSWLTPYREAAQPHAYLHSVLSQVRNSTAFCDPPYLLKDDHAIILSCGPDLSFTTVHRQPLQCCTWSQRVFLTHSLLPLAAPALVARKPCTMQPCTSAGSVARQAAVQPRIAGSSIKAAPVRRRTATVAQVSPSTVEAIQTASHLASAAIIAAGGVWWLQREMQVEQVRQRGFPARL